MWLKEAIFNFLTRISPTLNTQVWFHHKFGKWLDMNNPQTSNEKVLWLKLHTYYKNPLVTQCADKYAVREYVEKCGCGEILNELYGYFWLVVIIILILYPLSSWLNSYVLKKMNLRKIDNYEKETEMLIKYVRRYESYRAYEYPKDVKITFYI